MKHFLLIFFVSAFIAVSCTTNEIPFNHESSSIIPVDEVLATLNNAISALEFQTKSGYSREIAEIITVAKGDIISKGANEELVYVVNYKDDQGFALLAADRCLPDPIIAIVENGTMD